MSGLTPCDSCPAPCCRRFVVDVTTYDAYRLGAGLKLSMGDFAELIWLEQPDPKRRILLGDPQRYYRLVLRRVPDLEARAEDPGALRCSFLLPLGGRGLCAAYVFRPEICRTYPTHEKAGVLTCSSGTYCPENAWSIEKIDVLRFQADWVVKRRMHALNDVVIDGWNERILSSVGKRSRSDFYGYVTTVYRDLEARAPALFERPAPGAPPPAWPPERLFEVVDEVLRRVGWRTDETFAATCPDLGKRGRELPILDGPFGVDPEVLALGAEEDRAALAAETAALARSLGGAKGARADATRDANADASDGDGNGESDRAPSPEPSDLDDRDAP